MSDLPPIKKNAFDERKLALYGKKSENAKGAPKLTVGLFANNPRFNVFTNDPQNTILRAKLDTPSFMAVVEYLYRVADGEPGETMTWVNMTGAPQNKTEDSRVTVGKNNNGVVFITVYKDDGGERIVFPFLPSMYHKVFGPQGELEIGELSVMYAKAWARLLIELVPNVLDTHFMENPPHQQKGGGGGNFQRKGGGGGGNYGGNRGGGGGNYGGNRGGGQQSGSGGGPNSGNSSGAGFDDFDDMPM